MFLPATIKEIRSRGWDGVDIILISGDAYIDSPCIGAAVIGRVLADNGYRVGIIAQPDVNSSVDILRLGEPKICWGVTSGSVDSMVANYTAVKKRRLRDDLTAGGRNIRRPDRALIAYSNLIRRYCTTKAPIVLGGIEASLRRIAHYDYWDNRIRRSIMFDARADLLVYGMGEKAMLEIAHKLRNGEPTHSIPGTCHISRTKPEGFIELPGFEETVDDKSAFEHMFKLFARNNDTGATGLIQRHGDRYLIHNPAAKPLTPRELDRIYSLPYERDVHPRCARHGTVRAMDTIRFSITSHRGCCGGCNFCAISLHQGRRVISRSIASIESEARSIASRPDFKGSISDVGGPTANMYGIDCEQKKHCGGCADRRCLFPTTCAALRPDHRKQIRLLRTLRKINGIKKVFVASGIRFDLVLADKHSGRHYLEEIINYHVSGQMKIAPEHSVSSVLCAMGKPPSADLKKFCTLFSTLTTTAGKKQFLTYYFMAAHPGCTLQDMQALKKYANRELRHNPEQIQIFTPTPSTFSTLMYYTGRNPFTKKPLFVERDMRRKQRQKNTITSSGPKAYARKKKTPSSLHNKPTRK